MQKASTYLSKEALGRVEAAVVDAEKKTSVEIVPVIAAASGRYDRAEDLVGLWLGAVLMVVAWQIWPAPERDPGDWGGGLFPLAYVLWLVALIAGFVGGAVIASRTGWLRRLVTPKREMTEEVRRRAREAFFDQRIHHTAGATGVLVYVSLFERTVCILADASVMKVLPEGEVDRLCAALTAKMKTAPADGLVETIASLGEILSGPLPRAEDDVDELENAVVLID
ncbi:MAG: hypothetical protein KF886_25005 [Candidatus Hydrogenedentes bacterium]|nr:hypothetical protein [Candidatus Hydrogenedentota bacterium]